MFSCEFRKISKNTFSYRSPLVAASGAGGLLLVLSRSPNLYDLLGASLRAASFMSRLEDLELLIISGIKSNGATFLALFFSS